MQDEFVGVCLGNIVGAVLDDDQLCAGDQLGGSGSCCVEWDYAVRVSVNDKCWDVDFGYVSSASSECLTKGRAGLSRLVTFDARL